MLKKLFITAVAVCSFSAQAMLTHKTHELVKQNRPGVFKDAEGFAVRKNGSVSRVSSYDVDRSLRNLSPAQISKISKYISANKMTNGDLTLRLQSHLPGGPAVGAAIGWWAGWLGANGLAHAGMGIAAFGSATLTTMVTGNPMAGGAAAKATYSWLNASLQPAIQIAAQKAALAGGIAGSTLIPL